ncbi:hypothetical protein AB595_22000 [Massilia sp. WF1]|nr:hypothetical protein AB595_22000 [Massilia sp. WF1]
MISCGCSLSARAFSTLAAVHFAGHGDLAVFQHDLRGEGRLRPAQQGRQHLAGLVRIVVDRLLAQDDQLRLLLVGQGLQYLGHTQRLDLGAGLDQDAAIGADRHAGTQGFLGLGHAAGHGHDLGNLAGFLQAGRLFQRDLIERVHRHFDVGDIDAAAVGLDADLDVVVDHAFDGYQDFHSGPLENGMRLTKNDPNYKSKTASTQN